MARNGIFVTGAGGFVGRLLVPELRTLGRPVVALKGDLLDARTPRIAAAEAAMAKARTRFGDDAIVTGRGLKGRQEE